MEIVERWLPVVGYEGLYEVSDCGQVKSLGRYVVLKGKMLPHCFPPRMLKLCPDRRGYINVLLSSRNKKAATHAVHRLVLEAFIGPCPEGMECCHSPDRNPSNNQLDNLRWDTHVNNQADQIVHGTSLHGRPNNVGEKNGRAIFTNEQIAEIRRLWDGGLRTRRQLSDEFGCAMNTVWRITVREGYK